MPLTITPGARMPIIEIDRVTKEYKQGLKRMALGDIAAGADTVSNSFVGAALAAKTENWCLTQLTQLTQLTHFSMTGM